MAKHTESLAPFPAAVQAFWNCNGPSIDSAVKTYTVWLSDCGRVQDESLRFLRARLSEQLQAAAHFAACKSPTEAFDLQVEYAGNAVSEFLVEGKKMLELCGHLAVQGLPKQA
jgi:hypothetical protein